MTRWTKDEFIAYLEETLIPDLYRSGNECTAADFEACVLFMQGANEVAFNTMDAPVQRIS